MSTLGEARETFYDACQGLQLNSGCLAQMLSSDIGQVIVLIIGNLTPPYHKEDLQPLRSQGTQCLVMTVTPFPLPSIVSRSPLALPQGDESQKVNRMAHLFVAGIAKVHYLTLAASLGDWDRPRMSLKMPKRLPATFDISQLSPNGRDHRAASASRQLLSQLSCRHGGEKTLHLLPVLLHGSNQNLQFLYQDLHQLHLGSNHMIRDTQLRLAQSLPQLGTVLLGQAVLSRKVLPLPKAQLMQSLWCWILFEEIQRHRGVQGPKDLYRPYVVFFESHLQLVQYPRLVPHKPLMISREDLKLLSLLGVGFQRPQMHVVGAQKLTKHPGIKRITLRAALPKPIPRPIQRLGVDRKNLHPVIQKKIHNASFGLLYRCPKLYPTGAALIKPTTKFCHPLHTLLHPHLGHPATSLISHVHLMYPVPPINPQVVSSHISSLNLL